MGTTRGGWRVALRLARREALRRKAQTALMLVLICLPVLAVTAAAVVWRTQDVSSAESVERRMGSADAVISASGAPRVWQHFDPEVYLQHDYEGDPRVQAVEDVREVLGADRPTSTYQRSSVSYETDEGRADTEVVETDLADPLSEGLFEPLSGTFPPGPGEVVVNQALLDRGPQVGDELRFTRINGEGKQQEGSARIVGVAEFAGGRGYPFAAGPPGTFGIADEGMPNWLVGGGAVTWDDVLALNEVGLSAVSRSVLVDPPPDSAIPPEARVGGGGPDEATLTVLGTVIAMVLLEVVLLAGPAFAVRARAQAHTLALVAASGATPRQARRTILASGIVVGAVGGLVGVLFGIGVGALAVPLAQRLDATRFGPFEVPWLLLVPVALFGFLAAVLAAVVPAFSASRQDVVGVLGGRRGEGRPSPRSPVLGVVLLAIGIGSAAYGSRPGGAAPVLVAGSAIISVVGMILFVPVAVTLVARLASRFPLALRFAARDAARHRTRTVPAVAAVGATVAGVVALGIAVSSDEAYNQAHYTPQLRDGYASVSLGGGDASLRTDVATATASVQRYLPDARVIEVPAVETSLEDGELELDFRQGEESLSPAYWSTLGSPYGIGEEIPDHIAMDEAERARADAVLAGGGMVLLHDPDQDASAGIDPPVLDGDQVTIDVTRWDFEAVEAEGPTELASRTVQSAVAPVTHTSPLVAVFSPELVEQLGLKSSVSGLLVPGPISEEAEQDLAEALATLPNAPYFYVERGYQSPPEVTIVQLVLGVLGGVLMLGGTLTATFLALSDARPDLATMAAVGARPRARRSIAASYAAVVGLVGAGLGAPVGFIPGIAVSRPLTQDVSGSSVIDVPWLLVLAVVVGLPVLTALVVGACARGRLPLVARLG